MEANNEIYPGISAIESRSVSSTNEETQNSSSAKKKVESSSSRCFAWTILKGFIFIICFLFFLYQSIVFYRHYLTYPLTTRYDIKNSQELTKPAITICNRNPYNLPWFCDTYPKFCQTPYELEIFCLVHNCRNSYSKWKIPKLGYYAEEPSEELKRFLLDEYKNHSIQNMFFFRNRIRFVTRWNYTSTMVREPYLYHSKNVEQGLFVRCISVNLHHLSKEQPDTFRVDDEDEQSTLIARFSVYQNSNASFFPWKRDKMVFVAIHSPYVPVDPIDGISLQAGSEYNFHINLEEEHLQPYPYKSDCTDYEALWERRNKTGPRSQEMCRELCRLEFSWKCFGCDQIRVLNADPRNLCPEDIDEEDVCLNDTLKEEMAFCKRNCKRSCKKLKYRYSLSKSEIDSDENSGLYYFSVYIYLHVTILSQEPLYGAWDLFRYIGGLVGCWLGISVWALAGIFEKTFRKAAASIHKLKSKKN